MAKLRGRNAGDPYRPNLPTADGPVLDKMKAEMEKAGKELFENNPLSVVCATVCNHGAQCAGHCVLGRKGSPVQFYDIEK